VEIGLLKQNAFEVGRSILSRLSRPSRVSRTNIKALERAASLLDDQDLCMTVTRRSTVARSQSVAEKVMNTNIRPTRSFSNLGSSPFVTPSSSPSKIEKNQSVSNYALRFHFRFGLSIAAI
jgi:hypothetical protein